MRLIIHMSREQEPTVRDADLMPLLSEAFYAQVNREIDRAVRDRLEGLEPASMTDTTLLERYLALTGKDETAASPYLQAAAAIFGEG